MSRQERQPQRIIDNLVRATQNGAIGATFTDGRYIIYPGPVVDKDGFEPMLDRYKRALKKTGIPKGDVTDTALGIKDRFFKGTPREQNDIFNSLSFAVTALSNDKTDNSK